MCVSILYDQIQRVASIQSIRCPGTWILCKDLGSRLTKLYHVMTRTLPKRELRHSSFPNSTHSRQAQRLDSIPRYDDETGVASHWRAWILWLEGEWLKSTRFASTFRNLFCLRNTPCSTSRPEILPPGEVLFPIRENSIITMAGKKKKVNEAEMEFYLRRVFGKPSFRCVLST